MKRYRQLAALLLLTFISKLTPAQTGIYGTLIDNGGKPIANATAVLLKAKDSSVVKGTVSNSSGEFVFDNVRTDRYLVQWTITGFQQQVSPVFTFENGSSKDLGAVQLAEKPAVLNAVTVQAKKPLFEQQIDRMVVNVAASITSSGSNVLEVLERSPGITVDRQNGAIAMNGKDGIVLMINGRLSRMPVSAVVQMLEGM
ncbi:MAG TPA: carboxypeptidase-like regulatory domain-containing protein, partial [Flavisolibacter sp.]|nr:carboxypeptidase-like regulatory domain-containing protein [Flavisolibacter sp.]